MLERKYSGDKPETVLPLGTIDTQMHAYLPGFPALAGGPGLPPEPLPTPNDYRRTMEWLGIGRVVVTQGNAHQFDNGCLLACLGLMRESAFLADAALDSGNTSRNDMPSLGDRPTKTDTIGDIAKGVAVISGQTQDAEMEALSETGVVGARIMDLPGGAVGLAALEDIDARAKAFGWMMAIQFDGSNILDHEARLGALGSDWVLDHHGKFFAGVTPESPQVDAVKRLIDKGNCWFKFAGCYESSRSGGPGFEDVAAVARAISEHAPERIVWGTNWPHNGAKRSEDYPDDAALLDTVMGWFPSENARKLALVDNPERLFRFAR